jgi:hypothetical protein
MDYFPEALKDKIIANYGIDLQKELNHSMLRKLMFQGPGQTEMILQRTYYGKHLVPRGKQRLLTQEQ